MDWGSMVSGIIGGIHNRSDELSGREEQEKNRQSQEDFANTGIRKRVWDAKLAGIHPLFALNANLPTYSPSIPVQSDTSFAGDIGRGISGGETDMDRQTRAAQLKVLESEANRNDAVAEQARMSAVGRAAQNANTSQDGGTLISGSGIEQKPVSVTPVPKDGKFRSAWGLEMSLDPKYAMNHSQIAQDRWGEPGEWIEGAPLYVRELAAEISRRYRKEINQLESYGSWKFGHRQR